MAAIGANGDYLERSIALIKAGANVLVIDVAHGHHLNVKNAISNIRKTISELYPDKIIDIIAGNIATAEAAIDLQEWGAEGLRVGIGGGCFTPDMLVKTNKGLKSIKEINIGDIVYTHKGNEKTVINKFIYDCDEEIMVINDIECTKNHEFYVVNKKYVELINCDDDVHKYAEWVSSENLSENYLLIEL
jgi:hypothetical protein